jgi:dUTP pyrophosphatase
MNFYRKLRKKIKKGMVMLGLDMQTQPIGALKLKMDAKIPAKAHDSDAGYDLFAVKDTVILPGQVTVVETGIALEIPKGYWFSLRDKSGRAFQGLHVLGGVIDQEFRGEIKVMMINFTRKPITIARHEKVCNLILLQAAPSIMFEIQQFSNETERGEGGFGSTGVK